MCKLTCVTCPHLKCGHKFTTKSGMLIHAGKCEWKDEFEVDFITNHRGPVTSRQYQVRWKNYSSDFEIWKSRGNLHPKLIRDYELTNNVYVHEWLFHCDKCDLPCSSARGIAIHKARKHRQEKEQNFTGTLSAEEVKVCKLEKQLKG